MKPKFEVFGGKDGFVYFHLRAANGKIVCQSEGYSRERNALKGIASIKKNAGKARIVIMGK